jgi:hypothetical protein
MISMSRSIPWFLCSAFALLAGGITLRSAEPPKAPVETDSRLHADGQEWRQDKANWKPEAYESSAQQAADSILRALEMRK